jgi:hypothetical protein
MTANCLSTNGFCHRLKDLFPWHDACLPTSTTIRALRGKPLLEEADWRDQLQAPISLKEHDPE